MAIITILLNVTACSVFCPDPPPFLPKVDANGNCDTGDKVSLPWLFFSNTFFISLFIGIFHLNKRMSHTSNKFPQ